MKMSTRQLANRVEQRLKTVLPTHLATVTHTASAGVKAKIIMAGKVFEYDLGKSWTTCDMTLQQIERDYVQAKYGERTG